MIMHAPSLHWHFTHPVSHHALVWHLNLLLLHDSGTLLADRFPDLFLSDSRHCTCPPPPHPGPASCFINLVTTSLHESSALHLSFFMGYVFPFVGSCDLRFNPFNPRFHEKKAMYGCHVEEVQRNPDSASFLKLLGFLFPFSTKCDSPLTRLFLFHAYPLLNPLWAIIRLDWRGQKKHHTISLTFQVVASISIQPRNDWLDNPAMQKFKWIVFFLYFISKCAPVWRNRFK